MNTQLPLPTQFFALISAIMAASYLALLLVLYVRRREINPLLYWLLAFLGASAVWQLVDFLFGSPDGFASPLAMLVLLVSKLVLLMTTAVYLTRTPHHWWFPLGAGLIGLTLILSYILPQTLFVIPLTDVQIPSTAGGVLFLLLWLLFSLFTIRLAWHDYRRTPFPWHANRYLFWAMMLILIVGGEMLLAFTNPAWIVIGHLTRLLASLGLVYAVSGYIRFDVRSRFLNIIALSLVTLLSAVPATALLWFLWQGDDNVTEITAVGLLLLTTSVLFLIYQPYRHSLERFIYRNFIGNQFQTNQVIRDYTQAVSSTLDVERLSSVIIGTLSDLFEVSRGALMLVIPASEGDNNSSQENGTGHTHGTNGYIIEPIPAQGEMSRRKQRLTAVSPFVQTLARQAQPILQYEIDFNPDYRQVKEETRPWLANWQMEVYAPIRSGDRLVGFIALGPKNSGRTYLANELELIQLLADQTVAPLENARLYSTLGEQNEKVRLLNEDLVSQNERLEVMDHVKSDFITIASHELRTPLTQVKGYADILAAMNEENALTRDQTRQIVGHINRATLRLEQLISAMLDASQIDVDEMQMTFMKTQIETVMRLSLEPLMKATRERRIRVERHGLENLPEIYADFKRLVQAFNNLLGNAVKYTPDGGKLTLTAKLIGDEGEQYIEIAINDAGIGIDPRYQTLIFEKFFRIGDPQLHSTGSTKFMGAGPGLGLTIAKGVIEGHGGRIWVESEGEDKQRYPGSTFTVILPVRPPKMPDQPASLLEQQASGERPPWLIG